MDDSTYADLTSDPVMMTSSMKFENMGFQYFGVVKKRAKEKTPHHEEIVARFSSHELLVLRTGKMLIFALGSTRSPIDDIRFVQNTSSGNWFHIGR